MNDKPCGDNQLKLNYGGVEHITQAPVFGTIVLTFHNGKLKMIEESKKTQFK